MIAQVYTRIFGTLRPQPSWGSLLNPHLPSDALQHIVHRLQKSVLLGMQHQLAVCDHFHAVLSACALLHLAF